MSYSVTALLTGQAAPFRGDEHSAIVKSPISGSVAITRLGLAGDQQADRKHHGGPHMAVHHYPADHYAHWRGEIGDHPLLDSHGAFGENIAATGLTENVALIGDRFRLGTALLEVSQPRKPCWKIEHRFSRKGMVADILKTGRCGIYFRVLEEGSAKAGDILDLVDSGVEGWSVRRVFTALFGLPRSADAAEFAAISKLGSLSPELRERARNQQS